MAEDSNTGIVAVISATAAAIGGLILKPLFDFMMKYRREREEARRKEISEIIGEHRAIAEHHKQRIETLEARDKERDQQHQLCLDHQRQCESRQEILTNENKLCAQRLMEMERQIAEQRERIGKIVPEKCQLHDEMLDKLQRRPRAK